MRMGIRPRGRDTLLRRGGKATGYRGDRSESSMVPSSPCPSGETSGSAGVGIPSQWLHERHQGRSVRGSGRARRNVGANRMARRSTWAWIVALACAAVAASGCCKKRTDDGEEAGGASNDPGLEDPGESHRDSKVDRTIKCFNAAMRINKSANYYFKRLRGGKPRAGRCASDPLQANREHRTALRGSKGRPHAAHAGDRQAHASLRRAHQFALQAA